jgi:hypothetical protein
MHKLISTFIVLLLLLAKAAVAQITDPMIINWWFNTTNNKYNGILTDVEAVYYDAQYVYVKSSGIPKYYLDGQSVNNGKDLQATWRVPRTPTPATTHTSLMGGQSGLMLDGSVFFTPGDAQSYMNQGIWNRLAYYFEGNDMDASNGHSTPTNMYHHHFDNLELHNWDATKHSPIVAYAWDGYPVYGPYGYVNTDGTGGIKRIASSYVASTATTRTNGPAVNTQYPAGCFIEDWSYVASSGDLDEYNGRFCVTPEYPLGTYAYFTTVDASLKPLYPYFTGPTFYGIVATGNTGPTGGKNTIPGGATQYVPTDVKEVDAIDAKIAVYPVPVTDDLNIRLSDNKEYRVVLYDVKGSILERKIINSSSKLDMRSYSYGTYFIEVTDIKENSGFVKRIVKQ